MATWCSMLFLSEIYQVFVEGLGVSVFHSPPGADHMMSGPGGLEDTATLSVLLVCFVVAGCLGQFCRREGISVSPRPS